MTASVVPYLHRRLAACGDNSPRAALIACAGLNLDSCNFCGIAHGNASPLQPSLSLELNELSSKDAPMIAEGLNSVKALGHLSLEHNQLGGEGVQMLGEALSRLEGLESLNLKGNGIGGGGVRVLANTLSRLKDLKVLDLQSNNLGSTAGKSLAPALINLTKLEVLDIRNNNVTAYGARDLAKALGRLDRLRTVRLGVGVFLAWAWFDHFTRITQSLMPPPCTTCAMPFAVVHALRSCPC